MPYYMRYFVEDPKPPSEIEIAAMFEKQGGPRLVGDVLTEGDQAFAQKSVAISGDELFEQEIDEFRDLVNDAQGWLAKRRVQKCLSNATAIVAAQVLFGGKETEESLSRLDPLWEWLSRAHPGMLHADGEGFYEDKKLVLALE